MKRKFILTGVVLLIVSLACTSSSTGMTPTAVSEGSQTITTAQSYSETSPPTDSLSINDSEQSPQELLNQISEKSKGVLLDVTYCTVDGVELKMDVYFPIKQSGKSPLVIYIHGGGWKSGDKHSLQGYIDVPTLLDAGFAIAFLNYRLAPDHLFPSMLEDVKCAVRSFRANADKYSIDPDKIGAWGWSAGAHLSSMLALTDASEGFDVGEYGDESSRIQAVVLLASPADMSIDFSPIFIEARDIAFVDYDLKKASPITYITPDDPPFLILQGDEDPVVTPDQGQIFYESLITSGVEAELIVIENGDHSFLRPNQSPIRKELTTMIVDFFVKHLK
ncbi:MAG TPA: alpha/beta hydrolase [Anaerolineae bacterium]|nr:alpha/beta hydrolase [Anaerolineae bacterium]